MAKKITKTTAKQIVRFALSKKAADVLLLDLRKITPVSDFFIICSGTSNVHVKAIADAVRATCKKADIEINNVEGYEGLRWVLIDLIEIVVLCGHPVNRHEIVFGEGLF